LAPNLRFASITAGAEYTCGVTTTGADYCWGYSGLGDLVVAQKISFGNTYTLTPVAITGGHSFRQISAGKNHTCGVTVAAQVLCWGSNSGKLGNGTGTETSTPTSVSGGRLAEQVPTGFDHSCLVDGDRRGALLGRERQWPGRSDGYERKQRAGSRRPQPPGGGGDYSQCREGSGSYTCAISGHRLTTYC
jgi:alpha-tubulin suppressor-like RCC1 family protein